MFVILRGFYLLISHFQVYGTEAIALVVSLGERRSMDFFVSMEIEWILVTSYFLMLFSLGHKERHVEEEYDMRRAAQICREMTVNDKKGVRLKKNLEKGIIKKVEVDNFCPSPNVESHNRA